MGQTDTPATLQARFGERYRWLLLLSEMIGTMASVMSSTIINVAVPDMSRYFALGPGALAGQHRARLHPAFTQPGGHARPVQTLDSTGLQRHQLCARCARLRWWQRGNCGKKSAGSD